MYPDIKFYP